LGLLAQIARLGKNDNTEGDTEEQPSQAFFYDLTAYDDSSVIDPPKPRPISVTTIRRVEHRWTLVNQANAARAASGQPPLTDPEIDAISPTTRPGPWSGWSPEQTAHPERFIHTVQFSDGTGNLLQTRTQSDPVTVTNVCLPDDPSSPATSVTADELAP